MLCVSGDDVLVPKPCLTQEMSFNEGFVGDTVGFFPFCLFALGVGGDEVCQQQYV